ncbi:MAG: hypothetical protein WC894_02830 [Patescibacteria group bacterium]
MVEQQTSIPQSKITQPNINFCRFRVMANKEKHLQVKGTVKRPMCMNSRMGGEYFNSNSCIDIVNLGEDNCPIIAND